jgi:hypothetical protein
VLKKLSPTLCSLFEGELHLISATEDRIEKLTARGLSQSSRFGL